MANEQINKKLNDLVDQLENIYDQIVNCDSRITNRFFDDAGKKDVEIYLRCKDNLFDALRMMNMLITCVSRARNDAGILKY